MAALADISPDSVRVDRIGLGGGSSDEAWCYANNFMVVSEDSSFYEKSLFGPPAEVAVLILA